MANRRRARITPTDSRPEPQPLLFADQEAYEVIRPVVLFGFTPLERSQDTGVSARSTYRKAQRFEQHGLPGLLEAEEPLDSKRLLPRVIRRAIVELKAEYPALSAHELARICYARFGRRPSPHTIQRVLAEEPPPGQVRRRFPRYLEMPDPVHYTDPRFTTCPQCDEKTWARKLPLVIHIDPMQLVALNETCRYCPRCDLPIAYQDELEAWSAAFFGQQGVCHHPVWRFGVRAEWGWSGRSCR